MVVKEVFLCTTLTLQVLNEIKWDHLSTLTSLGEFLIEIQSHSGHARRIRERKKA